MKPRRKERAIVGFALLLLCASVFAWTVPGRISFPDDEIVFQTTRSLWERGDLRVEGIPKRTGEPPGQEDGTFGWARGRKGRKYGFFGHGVSVVALPLYGMGKEMSVRAPEAWRHAIRPNHYWLHPRAPVRDWTRLCVSLTNVFVTGAAAVLFAAWIIVLGFRRRTALIMALVYAFGTSAWPYTRTVLSEPLSALVLLGSAYAVARFHRGDGERWLWAGGFIGGLSVHVHLLNFIAVPCLIGYAIGPLIDWKAPRQSLVDTRRSWGPALAAGTIGVLGLGLSHYLRFGSPFESGRYGLYSEFAVPAESLVALMFAPGRSFWLYSPPALLAMLAVGAMWRRHRAVTAFALALFATRLLFVACRSDWWGGWALGPRYLVPAIPFAMLPLAIAIERFGSLKRKSKLLFGIGIAVSVLMQAFYSLHSIFEWMMHLAHTAPEGKAYLDGSHWVPADMPLAGFWELPTDMLSVGAVRLAQRGHQGFAWVFGLVALVGTGAAGVLARALWRNREGAQPEPTSPGAD